MDYIRELPTSFLPPIIKPSHLNKRFLDDLRYRHGVKVLVKIPPNPLSIGSNPNELFVNAYQYKTIMRRRDARTRMILSGRLPHSRRLVMYESRRQSALNRKRDERGTFLPEYPCPTMPDGKINHIGGNACCSMDMLMDQIEYLQSPDADPLPFTNDENTLRNIKTELEAMLAELNQ